LFLISSITSLGLLGCGNGDDSSVSPPAADASVDGTTTPDGATTDGTTTDGADARPEPADAGALAKTKRVLLISIDGMHEIDFTNYVKAKPSSTLAKLAATGVEYTDARTTTPSDSFPGMLALVTGGTPKTNGVYYDDSYDRTLYPPPVPPDNGGADAGNGDGGNGEAGARDGGNGDGGNGDGGNGDAGNGDAGNGDGGNGNGGNGDAGNGDGGNGEAGNGGNAGNGDAGNGDSGVDRCSGDPGTEIVYDESVDFDSTKIFSGGINPANLPHRKETDGGCVPVFPHEFLKNNTVFEVVKADGHRTAWSDKHAAYDLLNGPSGTGIDDLYTPEVNSLIANGGTVNGVDLAGSAAKCDVTNSLAVLGADQVTDYTTCLPAIEAYDNTKVQAVINWIDGKSADGSTMADVPAIFGMNFQTVSVGQKLPVGGYTDAAGTPTAVLQNALDDVDAALGKMVTELTNKNLLDSTLIIVSAKHGQAPIDRSKLAMENSTGDAGMVTDPLPTINSVDPTVDNVPSVFQNPNSGNHLARHGHFQTDSVGIVWLQDQSKAADVATALSGNADAIHANSLPPGTVFMSPITSGSDLAKIFGDPTNTSDSVAMARAPNVFIQPNLGVIYSGSTAKIAEHGGGSLDDTNVMLLVSLPAIGSAKMVTMTVQTTQVAPSILQALGLAPDTLQAVKAEGTEVLPSLF